MELFLASQLSVVIEDIAARLPKKAPEYRIVFIPTASNVYDDPWWMRADRDALNAHGFHVVDCDIAEKTSQDVHAILAVSDGVCVAGGNTFYLLEQVRKSGFDSAVQELLSRGGFYMGSSAGTVIVAPDIAPCKFFDEREKSHLENTTGLGYITYMPLPHHGGMNTALNEKVMDEYREWVHPIHPITDTQYIHVTDSGETVIDVEERG